MNPPHEATTRLYGHRWPTQMRHLSRVFDVVIAAALFLAVIAAFHLHVVLTVGDWDFWVDWKDRQYWVTVTPVLLITFRAAVSYILWENFRLPFGATFCALALALGQWIDRFFAFNLWSNFPISMVWPATIIPGALVLDSILLLTGSALLTAILGGMAFGLMFPVANWTMLAAYRVPVEVMGTDVASVADLIGYSFTPTRTPEYLRIIERGTLRTLGGHSTTVAAFYAGRGQRRAGNYGPLPAVRGLAGQPPRTGDRLPGERHTGTGVREGRLVHQRGAHDPVDQAGDRAGI